MLIKTQLYIKAILALMIGCFALLVGLDNILDYSTNFKFVSHVMSMDSMQSWFSGSPQLLSRAITNPTFHTICYTCIIATELISGLLCLAGGLVLLRSIGNPRLYNTGKTIFAIGATLALCLWYFGFCVVGGEYFSMWANQFNGQNKAYSFSTFILISLFFILSCEH